MNRLLHCFSLALFICTSAFSQELAVGIRGGFNQFSIGEINSRGGSIAAGQPDELFQPSNSDMGFQFGAYLTSYFGKFFVQPEFNYYTFKNSYDFPDKTANWNSSKFELPILIGYNVFGPISIYAGPGFNFFGDTELDGVQVTSFSDGGPNHEKSTVSLNFGIMVKWKRFGLDLRYEDSLYNSEEELLDIVRSTYGVNLVDLRSYSPSTLSLSLTVDLFRTDTQSVGGLFSGMFRSNKCHCPY